MHPITTPLSCPLTELRPGQSGTILTLESDRKLQQRLQALGLCQGQPVHLLRQAWLAGPLHIRVGMTELMLRRRDAARIRIHIHGQAA